MKRSNNEIISSMAMINENDINVNEINDDNIVMMNDNVLIIIY